jgi:hypothetical protein
VYDFVKGEQGKGKKEGKLGKNNKKTPSTTSRNLSSRENISPCWVFLPFSGPFSISIH